MGNLFRSSAPGTASLMYGLPRPGRTGMSSSDARPAHSPLLHGIDLVHGMPSISAFRMAD
jgi:hypothetical protein